MQTALVLRHSSPGQVRQTAVPVSRTPVAHYTERWPGRGQERPTTQTVSTSNSPGS